MHTVVICYIYGFAQEHLVPEAAAATFAASCEDSNVTCAALYDAQGAQINAYANPATFKH